MLAVSKSPSCEESCVNILPCRINHTGQSRVTKRHWQPRAQVDGTKTAYFRGRRLRGRIVKLPKEYHGVVLQASNKTIIESAYPTDEDDEEPDLPEVIKVVEQSSSFENITIWGHDQVPLADDSFVKGIEEWIAFAEAIHGKNDSVSR